MNKRPLAQSGFTIVELLVSTAVGLFLIAGLLSAYVSAAKTYRYQKAMSQVQETGRYLLTQVGRSVRNAGYNNAPDTAFIKGYRSAQSATEEIPAAAIISETGRIRSGDIVYIESYEGENDGIALYSANFQPDSGNSNFPSLYINEDPVLEGVEQISAEYGIDNDGDHQVDLFRPATLVTDWTTVKAVRLSFLVTNLEGNVLDSQQVLPLPFGDGTALAPDRRLYRSYTTTIALRNKMI